MSLIQEMGILGAEIRAKRKIQKIEEAKVEEAKKQLLKEQQQHEDNKRHGMI